MSWWFTHQSEAGKSRLASKLNGCSLKVQTDYYRFCWLAPELKCFDWLHVRKLEAKCVLIGHGWEGSRHRSLSLTRPLSWLLGYFKGKTGCYRLVWLKLLQAGTCATVTGWCDWEETNKQDMLLNFQKITKNTQQNHKKRHNPRLSLGLSASKMNILTHWLLVLVVSADRLCGQWMDGLVSASGFRCGGEKPDNSPAGSMLPWWTAGTGQHHLLPQWVFSQICLTWIYLGGHTLRGFNSGRQWPSMSGF